MVSSEACSLSISSLGGDTDADAGSSPTEDTMSLDSAFGVPCLEIPSSTLYQIQLKLRSRRLYPVSRPILPLSMLVRP